MNKYPGIDNLRASLRWARQFDEMHDYLATLSDDELRDNYVRLGEIGQERMPEWQATALSARMRLMLDIMNARDAARTAVATLRTSIKLVKD